MTNQKHSKETERDLRTVKQLSERFPAFTEPSLRWLIFNSESNGLNRAILRLGKKLLIDTSKFLEWIDEQQKRPKPT